MEAASQDRIESIKRGMTCPKSFECTEGGFETLCKAQDVGLRSHIQCLEEEPTTCPYSMPVGGASFCRCPLRVYVAKELHR